MGAATDPADYFRFLLDLIEIHRRVIFQEWFYTSPIRRRPSRQQNWKFTVLLGCCGDRQQSRPLGNHVDVENWLAIEPDLK